MKPARAVKGKENILRRADAKLTWNASRQLEPKVHAFVTVTEEAGAGAGAQADETIAAGNAGPLTGVPLAIKDVICTKGVQDHLLLEDAGKLRAAL